MGEKFLSVLLAVLAAAVAFALPAPAMADTSHGVEFAPDCHASSGDDRGFRDMIGETAWTCTNEDWTAHEPVAWLRFEAKSWAGEATPQHFFTRIARHRAISFAALDADGSLRTASFDEVDAKPFARGPVFRLPLPEITEQTEAILVRIERPHSVPLLTEARLTDDPDQAGWSQMEVMLLAFVIGMLLLPLLFDISFFVVLRERFVVLHAIMVITMMSYVLFAGGLVSVFASLSVMTIAIAGPLSWAIGCGVSALFLADFLEKDAQSPLIRRLTIAAGIWAIFVPGFFALQLHATQAFDDRLYFYTFLPFMLILTIAVGEAVWRGSRSARFLAVAWAPIILASADRMLRGLGVYVGPSALDQAMYVTTGLEVIVISLAIGDHFFAMRRERDEAVTEARMLEQLSERDGLTGLMNRRALESQFDELRHRGFDTFALIDLDRFKQVNDDFGHQVGDSALIACAQALRNNFDRDLITTRLGGEEFVVLLRGPNAVQRAEALRQAIPVRIARDIEGLEMPVTASMGVVEVPLHQNRIMSFEDFYSRADELMYEAKASGRNRMAYEKLTVFENPGATPKSGSSPRLLKRKPRRRREDRVA